MISIEKILQLSKIEREQDKIKELKDQFVAISNLIGSIKFAESSAFEERKVEVDFENTSRDDSCARIKQENDFLFIAPRNKNRTYLVPNIL